MKSHLVVFVFVYFLSVMLGCKSETNPQVLVKMSEHSKDEQLRKVVDKIAEDFDARIVAMTENGIRVYLQQIIVACLMGSKNFAEAPPPPELGESFWAEFAFFGAAIKPESTTQIDRERAKAFVSEMLKSELFFAPGNGFFFPSEAISKINWITESKAAIEFTYPALEGVSYIFVQRDADWLFDDIEVIPLEAENPIK